MAFYSTILQSGSDVLRGVDRNTTQRDALYLHTLSKLVDKIRNFIDSFCYFGQKRLDSLK